MRCPVTVKEYDAIFISSKTKQMNMSLWLNQKRLTFAIKWLSLVKSHITLVDINLKSFQDTYNPRYSLVWVYLMMDCIQYKHNLFNYSQIIQFLIICLTATFGKLFYPFHFTSIFVVHYKLSVAS